MHVATKDSSKDGSAHLLTTVIEADGAFELCHIGDDLKGEILSVRRTDSGGIEVQVAVSITKPVAAPLQLVEDPGFLEAVAYIIGKGYDEVTARKKVNVFSAARVLAAKDKELNDEAARLAASNPPPPMPEL